MITSTGADPGLFLGGGALVSCSTSTAINHFFFLHNTSCIRKPQVISGGGRTPCTLPLDPPLTYNEIYEEQEPIRTYDVSIQLKPYQYPNEVIFVFQYITK